MPLPINIEDLLTFLIHIPVHAGSEKIMETTTEKTTEKIVRARSTFNRHKVAIEDIFGIIHIREYKLC